MSAPTRPETTTGPALWLGALLVTLAGLFGRHGLDSHGVGDVVTGHGGMADGVAGGSMAVLAVALIALVRRLGNARGRPLCRVLARPARAPDTHVRDPDPPTPITPSIQRC